MPYRFSTRSESNLTGVHPDLVAVARRALELSPCDFTVVEGVRSIERQLELVAKGASKTKNSKHLLQPGGFSHAIDLYPYWGGTVHTEDSRENLKHLDEIAEAFKEAARELGVKITWGGDWRWKDQGHFQIEVPKDGA
jgi:peptidoglycan L-alanyl-D-glutamate endopeptidase CwlK